MLVVARMSFPVEHSVGTTHALSQSVLYNSEHDRPRGRVWTRCQQHPGDREEESRPMASQPLLRKILERSVEARPRNTAASAKGTTWQMRLSEMIAIAMTDVASVGAMP